MDDPIIGKLLPNLKITLGSNSCSDEEIEDGEITDGVDASFNEISCHKNAVTKDVDVVRTWMKTLQQPKVYENKDGGFVTGLDLSSEVLRKKLEERAERFGLEKKEESPITQTEIDALYKSLNIDPENLNSCKLNNIRLEALHMRGVNEMNTSEIFMYFGDYGPASVEWINDFSCNVMWLDKATTARALIGMSRPLVMKEKPDSLSETVAEKGSEIDSVIDIADSEESEDDERRTYKKTEAETAMDADTPLDSASLADNTLSEIADVPVPPGHWRLGLPHSKAKTILLRFATKDDKKLPGAEKRSQYYQKYGNPNYGGLKGLISTSRKRKIHASQNRQIVEDFSGTSKTDTESDVSFLSPVKSSRVRMPRMKMYADEEEEKKKQSVKHCNFDSKSVSIHSRLGTKYTRDDLYQLGSRFSAGSEDEEDDIAINCTVPSRYNIWTDIAMSMSEEDKSLPRNSKLFSNRASQGYKSSQDLRVSLDSRLSRNRRPSHGARMSIGKWQSRNRSRDMQSTFGSSYSQIIDSASRGSNDLRSRIKKIKSDDNVKKHRSPLCKDD